MLSQPLTLNSLWADLIIEELVRQGCSFFCISPGSRSTPLTLAVARNGRAQSDLFYDERAAAYFALGYARATGKPAVLICTSGTAAANYLPAIIEASEDFVPMLVLTADRPPELRQTGANQTIDQIKLYGDHVRWFFDMPCPDERIAPEMVLTTVDHAVHRSQSPTPGPVHLNCPFREPLAPLQPEERDWDAYLSTIVSWQNHLQPYTPHSTAPLSPSNVTIDELAERFHRAQKGLIVAGQLGSAEEAEAVVRLADKLRWPLAADVGSGLRLERRTDSLIPHFDLLLLSETMRHEVVPDVILFLGKRVVSKRFLQMLARHRDTELIHVAPFAARLDPEHRVSRRIQADVAEFCRALTAAVKPAPHKSYFAALQSRSDRIAQVLQQEFRDEQPVSEPGVLRRLSQMLPKNSGLFLANSMPIRDMDMFGDGIARDVRIAVNRGASGIDGNLATACGFAHGLGRLTTAVLGDLALIHDLNSMMRLKQCPVPVIVIVLNNQGGGIFSFLPVHAVREHFERFFGTPHDLTFGRIAEAFGLAYEQPATLGEFAAAYARAVTDARPAVIEIRTDREANRRLHAQMQQHILAALEETA